MREPPLLRVAALCLGIVEIAGPASNPAILRWAKDIGAPAFTDDATAWCAVAMNRWCLACEYPLAGKGYDLLRARSFETWGQPLLEPTPGAVMVFSRQSGAHVALYLGETSATYRVRGGNQGDAVSDTWIAKSRLTSIRWPSGVPVPSTGPVMLLADGSAVSENEA